VPASPLAVVVNQGASEGSESTTDERIEMLVCAALLGPRAKAKTRKVIERAIMLATSAIRRPVIDVRP
jgi:hypothetical protein